MEWVVVLGFSFLLGITMKAADLCDEHELRFFRSDRIIWGLLWGLLVVALMRFDDDLAIFWLAIILGFVGRGKIDYPNHGLASLIILIYVFWHISQKKMFQETELLVALAMIYYVIGVLHDRLTSYLVADSNGHQGLFFRYSEQLHTLISYALIPVVLSIMHSNALIIVSSVCFGGSYELTRLLGPHLGRPRGRND